MIKKSFVAALLLALTAFNALAFAQTPSLTNGLAWLDSAQTAEGACPGAETSDFVATSAVSDVLFLLNSAGPGYVNSLQWLAAQPATSTDYLARRIITLVRSGQDASADVPELISLSDGTGGWGGETGHLYNILDTALALQALKSANYSDQTVINPALAYLTTSQNPDGGWGFLPGDDSNVYMTAVVSSTLQQFPQMNTISVGVSRATSYLLAHQNADGGFGSSSSAMYETAMAYSALAAVSTNEAALTNAVNYLTTTQAANGSWNDAPFSTALALKALFLSENRPSPPPPPPAGGTITGTVVDATTNQRLVGVSIVLGSDPLINAITDASGNFTLYDVPPGSQQVNLSLADFQSADVTASVAVDTTFDLGTIGLVSSYSTGTIAGTITDPAGKPLDGVTVTVAGAWSGSAITGADGGFLFTYVTPGEVTITASKAGWQAATSPGTVYARTTLSFSPRLNATQSQATTGTLVGRVVDSYWGVPIDHLPGEQGVTVTLSGGISAEPDPDNRGYFEIANLVPDTYQVTVGMNGFASQTFRVVIAPGVTTDLGTIRLSMSMSMTLTGKVTDAVSGTPIPGAAVSVAGTLLTGWTDSSGTYAIADIDHAAEITVRASAAGYTGKSILIGASPWTQTMNIALTPRATTGEPTGTEVDVTVQTDKNAYTKSDPIGLAVTLWNKVGQDYATALHVKVIDPAGEVAYDTSQELNLVAGATFVQYLDVVLPLSAPGGMYTIIAEALNADGMLLGAGTKTVGVSSSQITVTPTLPKVFISGENTISFELANTGTLAVSAGVLDMTLTDPDGEVVFTASKPFALDMGENTTLDFSVLIPDLKFGTYKLAYVQSDEMIAGAPTELSLPSSLAITAIYDDNSRRIRSTAGLMVTLANTGRFNLDPTGAGLLVAVSVPDAGYEETKTFMPVPADGGASGGTLLYQFAIPETVTAGLHPTTITVSLPSGSTLVQTAQLAILESSLTLSLLEKSVTAGETIRTEIANTGGVDSPVQYTLRLLDAKAAEIAQISDIETARAGEALVLSLDVPSGAVDGSYQVIANFMDVRTGNEQIVPSPITVIGVKGSLQVKTDKEEYLATEEITALSSIANNGTVLQDGNLHLQIATTAGTRTQRTWTSQEDFRQGVRKVGVDTYGVNDWIIPDDDFNESAIDGNKWSKGGNVRIQDGKLFIDSSTSTAGVSSMWSLDGDFDIQIDFSENNSRDNGVSFSVNGEGGGFSFTINNTIGSGYGCDFRINGIHQSWTRTGKYSLSGRLRIVRISDIIIGYYWNGSDWSEINRGQFPEFTESAKVIMSIWRGPGYPGPNTAKYDNFKLESGKIKTENQTIGSVRLLPLNDNFDDGQLNLERWGRFSGDGAYESNGAVHFTGNAEKSQGLRLNVALDGDFNVISEYENFKSTPTWAHQGRYAMYAFVGSSGFYMNRLSGPNGQLWAGLSWIDNTNYQVSSIYNNTDNGRFRLRRQGTIGLTDYWDGTRWVNIHSRSGMTSKSGSIVHWAYSEANHPTVFVDLDHFIVEGKTYSENGIVVFKHDSGSFGTRWDSLFYTSSEPSATSLKFRTRTADIEADLANALWSDYLTASGSLVTSPAARWIEIEATLATADTDVTPLLHDLTVSYDRDPGQVLWETDVPAHLPGGAIDEHSDVVGTLGVTGKLILRGELTSSTGQMVSTAEYPFYVEQGNMAVLLTTDKKIYRPGETVTVSGEVKNRSKVASEGLVLRVADPGSGEEVLFSATFDLPAQSSYPFIFTTTAGADGQHALSGIVTQNSAILEEVTEQYETASPMVTATLTAPDVVGSTPFAINVALSNTGKIDAVTRVQVTEGNGAIIGAEDVTIPAGESRLIQYSHLINTDTLLTAVVSGDLDQTFTQKVVHVSLPSYSSVKAKIATDKITYNPNESAALTATLTATSMLENLSALVTVTNDQGQVLYSAIKPIPVLIQGQSFAINNYWNVGTNPAGTYHAALHVLDTAENVVAKSTCDLVINATSKPAGLLKGELALAPRSVYPGEPVAVSYRITNVGNVDLTTFNLSLKTVSTSDQLVYRTITDQASLAMGAIHVNTARIDTQGYSANDYLVVLTATIDGVEETLAGVYFQVKKDETPPELVVHSPVEGETYRTGVAITAQATDLVSGIERVECRLDNQQSWTALAPADEAGSYSAFRETTFNDDGPHTILVRAVDKAGNQSVSTPIAFEVVTDVTPPETRIEISEPRFQDPGGPVYLTGATTFSLTATDDLSGVQATYYRFDDQATWREYEGSFSLAGLGYGTHAIHFFSIDNAGNHEVEKSIEVTLIGIELESEILNLPRVLVWAGEPAEKVAYTLDDIRALASEALASPDAYFKLTSDKAEFQDEFRSGLYNMVFILDQDLPFNAPFLREIRDAVGNGLGLLVSHWGNSVHPILQETLGVDFRGSLPMAEDEHALYLYPSPFSDGQSLVAKGRVLKTKLNGSGALAGIFPEENACSVIRKLTLNYPVEFAPGDLVSATLYQEQDSELRMIDEESHVLESLPAIPAGAVNGDPTGDLAIDRIASDGAVVSISAPFGYLEEKYAVSITVNRPDGSSFTTGPVNFAPVCSANLQNGVLIGPFRVEAVGEDEVADRADVPAIVLGSYGKGKTVFMSYNIVESALETYRQEQSDLLRRAAGYLLPETELQAVGGVVLVENRVKMHGAGLNLTAIDSLGNGLLHLSIFGLENQSLAYSFHLEDDEEYTYRYFIKSSEDAYYSISTDLYLEMGEENLLFDRHTFNLSQ